MESWFIYAIIASILIGINNFLLKVFAEKRLDSNILMFVYGALFIIFWFFGAILFGEMKSIISWYSVWMGLVATVLYFFNIRYRVRSLEHITSSEYFIGYRIISTTLLIILWLVLFGEHISQWQYLGIWLWFIAIILLFEKHPTKRSHKIWMQWVGFLFITIFMGVLLQVFSKYFSIENSSFLWLFFWEWVFYIILSYIFYDKKSTNTTSLIASVRPHIWFTLFIGIISYIATVLNMMSYQSWGNLGIVIKIVGYSLFIPIMLSHFIYKEPITYKKWISFTLTIVSIWYLV